ncbi:DUF6600 domain-containing protein [Pedobacter foliorum]|uniref:DUF6600 domain-containing protein n=1 Tax=Pedobacter foliorum TaxID=2739058 RepID=UPI001566FE4A|nr:DUF6600 domain-containing protein [Pedobacter foliorum]NRF41724.1 hypothetical protein [Pedobacter foliorum]
MKNIIKLPAIVLGLMLLLTGTAQRVMAQDEDISLQSFYDELSPYGTWIQDSQYGYVWRPDVEQADFRPYYSNGRWAMTEYGNTWISNYDWGWAPFHYGRWVYNRYSQWVWIPDTVWGPAWVSWRSGGGYYGWAPMGPGMNININFNIPDLWWVFVPQRNIYYNDFPRYYSRRNVTIIHNTTIINNVYSRNNRNYYSGPRADDIRRSTRQAVPVYNIDRTSRPGRSSISGNKVEIYRPNGRSSRETNAGNVAPRNPVRGEGYASPRTDRNSVDRGNTDGRVSNGRVPRDGSQPADNRTTDGTRVNSRPERVPQGNTSPSQRPDRPTRQDQTQPRQEVQPRQDIQPRQQPSQPRQERIEPQPRQERQTRQEVQPRPQPQQRQEPVQQPRQERAPQQTRQEAQPRQEQARPQPQRSERVEQSRPSRGSESNGGGRESRPSRSGRD